MKRPATAVRAHIKAGKTQEPRPADGFLAGIKRGATSGRKLPPGLILLEDPWALQDTLAEWRDTLEGDVGTSGGSHRHAHQS